MSYLLVTYQWRHLPRPQVAGFGCPVTVFLTNKRLVIKKASGVPLSERYDIQNVNWALSHLEGESIPMEDIIRVKAGRNIRLTPYLRVIYQAPAGQKVYTFWQDEDDRTCRQTMKEMAKVTESVRTGL